VNMGRIVASARDVENSRRVKSCFNGVRDRLAKDSLAAIAWHCAFDAFDAFLGERRLDENRNPAYQEWCPKECRTCPLPVRY
jgi:hypothetical protein